MNIRLLTPADAHGFQALRLAALLDTPASFAASHDEEKDMSLRTVEARLAPRPDCAVFGAHDGETLVGIAGLARDTRAKLAHKADLWGMYVTPQARGDGVARQLLEEVLVFARSMPGLAKVKLYVDAANVAAIALYESLGFIVFGRESDAVRIGGRAHDELQLMLKL